MSDIHNVLYPPKEHDTCVSHCRYDGKERLIAWSVRDGDHFLVFRVNAFREVTLADGEKLDVPETIQCRFSEQEISRTQRSPMNARFRTTPSATRNWTAPMPGPAARLMPTRSCNSTAPAGTTRPLAVGYQPTNADLDTDQKRDFDRLGCSG